MSANIVVRWSDNNFLYVAYTVSNNGSGNGFERVFSHWGFCTMLENPTHKQPLENHLVGINGFCAKPS